MGVVGSPTRGNPWLKPLERIQPTRNPFGNLNRNGADFPHEMAIDLTPTMGFMWKPQIL